MPAMPCCPRSTPSARCSPSPASLARWWSPRRPVPPARGSSSRAEPTSLADAVVAAPARRAVELDSRPRRRTVPARRVPHDRAGTRGPPGGGAPAITSEILVHLSPASPQRIPGAQGPFLVTTARRATAASVESGWVDRAPGTLLSLFFLLFLLWTRGRRSTRPQGRVGGAPVGPCSPKVTRAASPAGHGVAGGADTGGAMHIAVRSDRFGRTGRCGLPRWRAAEAR